MKVVVTGAAGFLGSRLADRLLAHDSPIPVTDLLLVDIVPPPPRSDSRARRLALELSAPGAADQLIQEDTDLLFHLAAIVSGHAEMDLDIGLRVNLDATRALLERARLVNPRLRLVFTSTCGVFGGDLPPVLDDTTAPMPQNSYGTAKAMSELLINDYSRRGLVDGRVVRLPTVTVRAGKPNRAVTSFASGVVREPLAGEVALCPVPPEQELWVTSPATVVRNILHAATLPTDALAPWRVVNLPGFVPDELVARMVASFPLRFDNTRALKLGFSVDTNFEDVIRAYIRDDLNGSFVEYDNFEISDK
ncbi:NAD dependent epimerase/dehydratase family domain-containing protein [Phthorimaea operculella]|nr:NAD dependent epimerase/dehydratase family domain-containing protein [Phthorimaea operculella]